MNQNEKDLVKEMYSRYNWQCFLHGNPAKQRAHIIGDTKLNRRVYGNAVIDNPLNWLPACGLACNKKCDIGFIQLRQKVISDIIKSDIPTSEKREKIERIIKEKNR